MKKHHNHYEKSVFLILDLDETRWNVTEELNALRARESECTVNVSRECLGFDASEEKVGDNFSFLQQGQSLYSEGKVSICLVLNDHGTEQLEGESGAVSYLQTLLDDEQRFLKVIIRNHEFWSCHFFMLLPDN